MTTLQVTGPGPGRLYLWLFLAQGLTWYLAGWVAALIGVVVALVVVVALEALRSARLKVVVDDGTVRLGRLFGAPVVVAAADVQAVLLAGFQVWANSPGLRAELELRDGSSHITPLRALRAREAQESELRAAAAQLGERLSVPVREAEAPSSA